MNETLTPPPGQTGPDQTEPSEADPSQADAAVGRATRLARQRDQRILGGVAAGIARSLDVDPLVVRVTLAVLGLFGVGVVLYVALWLLLPDEAGDHAALDLEDRTRGIVVLVVLAVAALWLVGLVFGVDSTPLGIIALIGGLLLWRRERRTDRTERAARAAYATDTSGVAAVGPEGAIGAPPPGPSAGPSAAERRLARRDARLARRREAGPLLLGPTAAVIALTLGVLGLIEAVGSVDIAPSAYVAASLAVVGAALVVASRYGRPLLLGVIGFGLAVALVPTTIAENWEMETVTVAPATSAGIPTDVSFDAEDYRLDLAGLTADELAGEQVAVRGDLGEITVRVPADVPVVLSAAVEGAGEVRAMADTDPAVSSRYVRGGFGIEAEPVLLDPATNVLTFLGDGPAPADALRLDLTIGFGEIHVERAP